MFTELNEAMAVDQEQKKQEIVLDEDSQAMLEGLVDSDLETFKSLEESIELNEMASLDSELEFIDFGGQLNEGKEDKDLEEIANEDSPEDQMESLFDAEIKVTKPAKTEDPADDKDTQDLENLDESESFIFDNLFTGE